MTQARQRPCNKCRIVLTTARFCDACRKEAGWHDPRRGSTAERGYGTLWRKLRLVVIKRDKGLCQLCLAAGHITKGKDVDHVIPKAQGGTDVIHNLQLLCRPCHITKTGQDKHGGVG